MSANVGQAVTDLAEESGPWLGLGVRRFVGFGQEKGNDAGCRPDRGSSQCPTGAGGGNE